MDIATLIGLLGGFGIIIGAIATGGDVMLFVNVPSILIVVGGTFMVTLMQVSLADFLGSFAIGMKAFLYKVEDPKKLIEEAVALADVARKNGLLALEGQEISNEFMAQGIALCADGHDPPPAPNTLPKPTAQTISRREVGRPTFVNRAPLPPPSALAAPPARKGGRPRGGGAGDGDHGRGGGGWVHNRVGICGRDRPGGR